MKPRLIPIALTCITLGSGFSLAAPQGSGGDVCAEFACPAEFKLQEIADTAEQAAEDLKDAISDKFDEVSDAMHKPKESLLSSGCLDGLKGLNLDAQLVDPSNIDKLAILKMVQDFIKDTACSAAVEYSNSQMSLVNEKIDDIGALIEEESMGLASGRANTSRKGFGASLDQKAIQESRVMNDVSRKVNSTVNEEFFGESNPFDGKNKIDLTNDENYDNPEGSSESSDSMSFEELEQGALCFLSGC